MNSKANVAIQTLHGIFVQSLFIGDGERAASLFADRPDVRMELPDDGLYLQGPQEIRTYLAAGQWPDAQTWVISHTPAIRVNADGRSARASWYATSFRLISNDLSPSMVQGSARFDADLVLEQDEWRYLHLQYYYMMTLEPNPYVGGLKLQKECGRPFYVPAGSVPSTTDFVALSNLMGRWSVDRRNGGIALFSQQEDCELVLPNLLEEPCIGRAAVEAGLKTLAKVERENEPWAMTIPMITTPVIVTDGDRAEGVWLMLTHDCKGPAFGRSRENSYVESTLGNLRVTFCREAGDWKIHKYEFRPFLRLPDNRILEASFDNTLLKIGWREAPVHMQVRNEAAAADILKLEEYVAFWVSGLRYRSEAPFYYSRLAIERSDLLEYSVGVLKTSRGLEAVTQEIFAMVNKFVTYQPKAPGNHIGTTPVIELAEDGQRAEAVWLDYGWTTVAQVFGITEPPFKANPAIGRYHFKFIKLDGVWKVYYFNWTPFFRAGIWEFDYAKTKGWSGTTSCRRFPLPLEQYVYEHDPARMGEKVVLEPSCVPCPYEKEWTGELDSIPSQK